MGKKAYFSFVLLLFTVTYYFQFAVSLDYAPLPVLLFIRDALLVAGGFSLYFNRSLLEDKRWGMIFKFLVALTVATFIYQIWPTSYYGDFSLLNGAFLTNVFVYLLILCLYLPLFFAVHQLSKPVKTPKKKNK